MYLSELKNKASMSELALIEKVETLIRSDIKSDIKEIVGKRLLDFARQNSNGFGPDSFRIKELVQDIIEIVNKA